MSELKEGSASPVESARDQYVEALKKLSERRDYHKLLSFVGLGSIALLGFILLDMTNILELPERTPDGFRWFSFPAGSGDESADISSLMTVLIPIVTLLVAFFVGTTGLNRLQLYDNELRENRKERRQEMATLRAEVFEQIREAEKEAQKAATREAMEKVDARVDTQLSEQKERLEEMAEMTMNHVTDVSTEIEKYKWVLEDQTGLKDSIREKIGSVGELHNRIQKLADDNQAEVLKNIIDHYFPPNDPEFNTPLRGASDDFFNSATVLAKLDLEPYAYRVCQAGLRFYPENADLISNALKFAADSGEEDAAKDLYAQALELPNDAKNWRLWVFVGDYVKVAKTPDEIIHYYRDTYLGRFFDDDWSLVEPQPQDALNERMMAQLARFYERIERFDDAIEVAETAVKHIPRVPQCAGLLSGLYLEAGRFEEALEMADKSLMDDARHDSNTNHAAQLMNKASALDAILFRDAGRLPAEELAHRAQVCLGTYTRALISKDSIGVFGIQVSLRTNAITSLLQEHGLPDSVIGQILPGALRQFVPDMPTAGGSPSEDGRSTTSSGGDGDPRSALSQLLLLVKAASERDQGSRLSAIGEIVQEIRRRGIVDEARQFMTEAADHFNDDTEERDFVAAIRQVVTSLDDD